MTAFRQPPLSTIVRSEMSAAATINKNKKEAASGGITGWARFGIEAGVCVGVALLAAAALLMPSVASWLASTLAFGWGAVAFYSLLTAICLIHNPVALFRRWNWWLAGVMAMLASVLALSLAQGSQGPLYSYGLAGEWGYAITGGSLAISVAGWLVCGALVGLLVIPHGPKRYFAGLCFVALCCWVVVQWTGKGLVLLIGWLGAGAAATGRSAARVASTSSRIKIGRPSTAALVPKKRERAPRPQRVDDHEPDSAPAQALIPSVGHPTRSGGWQLPQLDLLAPSEPHHIDTTAIQDMSEEIKEALAEHGVYVDVEDVKAGPRVVRFGLVPGYIPQRAERDGMASNRRPSRVRVGDIAKRQKDLALALKSPYIRIIETPEPGEGLVGLEVPNPSPGKVLMRSIVEGQAFNKVANKGGLAFALGEDAGGESLVLDLASMPHLLIAGATGSGKSVCINSLVVSLLMTRPPDELRMIMVDPKRVELTPFNGIPHLVMPVIVEPDEVYDALRGLINEMTNRYRLMEEIGVRNISGYNDKSADPMPFLVLIVDELADLMMTGGLEVEQQLVRLAQLGRAAGIHMVLATQRPSVKVVTGLLKANVPARVAFAVASQVDSRVILDTAGAEALMGKGDLLLQNNDYPKARRGQGTLVFDDETDRVIEFWRGQIGPPLKPINLEVGAASPSTDDELDNNGIDDVYEGDILQRARDMALRNPRINSAMLERRLKIRKSIADEIMEELHGEGLVIEV